MQQQHLASLPSAAQGLAVAVAGEVGAGAEKSKCII
jgi:hypothetical protein